MYMKIILISNEQDFVGILKKIIKEAKEMLLEIAFVRHSGFLVLEDALREFFSRRGKLKLLVGEDFNLTQSKALKSFLNLGAELKVYKTLGFTYHPKSWIIKSKDNSYKVIVGSSNISKGALTNNVELN